MAQSHACPEASLLGIPLEIRHMIFEHASARNTKPKRALQRWFENKDVKDQIAAYTANDPNGPAPRVVMDNRMGQLDEPDSEDEVEPDHQDEVDDDDDDDSEDDEDEADDNEQDEDEEGEDDEAQAQDAAADEEDMDVQQDEAEGDVDMAEPDGIAADSVHVTTAHSGHAEATAASDQAVEGATVEDEDEQMHDGDSDGDDESDGKSDTDGESDHGEANTTTTATHTAPPPPQGPVVTPHRKWRHVPKFVRLTQCPPPPELFLINKQINEEAKHWLYKVAVLKIDATASFSHFSFFEVALGQIAEAAFSPMENIRKAEVRFVWDTTWIRAESTGYAANVFSFFLDSRAKYVLSILQRAPDLAHLTIHWHDTANDAEAQMLMQDILEQFVYNLSATIDTKTHIIASDLRPNAKSIAGKRRLEFQAIVDNPPQAF